MFVQHHVSGWVAGRGKLDEVQYVCYSRCVDLSQLPNASRRSWLYVLYPCHVGVWCLESACTPMCRRGPELRGTGPRAGPDSGANSGGLRFWGERWMVGLVRSLLTLMLQITIPGLGSDGACHLDRHTGGSQAMEPLEPRGEKALYFT